MTLSRLFRSSHHIAEIFDPDATNGRCVPSPFFWDRLPLFSVKESIQFVEMRSSKLYFCRS